MLSLQQESTQFTVHREQRIAGCVSMHDPKAEMGLLMKNIESVYTASLGEEATAKKWEREKTQLGSGDPPPAQNFANFLQE